MLIENAPVVRKKNPAAGAFFDKIFQIYKSDWNTRKKGLQSEAKTEILTSKQNKEDINMGKNLLTVKDLTVNV